MQSSFATGLAASGRIRRDAPPASSLFARPLFAVYRPAHSPYGSGCFGNWVQTLIHVTFAIPGREDREVRVSPDVFVSQRRFATSVLRVTGWPMPLVSRAVWAATTAELLRRGRE